MTETPDHITPPDPHSPQYIETPRGTLVARLGDGEWIVYTQDYTHIAGTWCQYQQMVDDLNAGDFELFELLDEDDGSCESPQLTVREIEERAAGVDVIWYERTGTLLERLVELYVELLSDLADDPNNPDYDGPTYGEVKADPLLMLVGKLIFEARKWKEAAE